MATYKIPIVDVPADPRDITPEIGKRVHDALRDIGFVAGRAGAADAFAVEVCREVSVPFFGCSLEEKMRYYDPKAQGERGYSFPEEEWGRQCKLFEHGSDLKEFIAVGRDPRTLRPSMQSSEYWDWLKKGDLTSLYRPNIWPNDIIPGFQQLVSALYQMMSEFGARQLRAIAVYLGLPWYFFDRILADGADMIRLLHYLGNLTPEQIREVQKRMKFWGCKHQDLSIGTVLARGIFHGGEREMDSESGLFIKPKPVPLHGAPEEWLRGVAPEGHLIFQLGNMGARLLSMFDPEFADSSAFHEIRAPRWGGGPDRYNVALFKHAVPHFVANGWRSGSYVTGRLGEIGFTGSSAMA